MVVAAAADWDELTEIYDGVLLADGFEEALIGFGYQFNYPVAIYDLKKCYNILIERDGMDDTEAMEYMDFNVLGAYNPSVWYHDSNKTWVLLFETILMVCGCPWPFQRRYA